MSHYVYRRTEPCLLTVGFYDPEGKWIPDSDYESNEEAAQRVRFLNGGEVDAETPTLRDQFAMAAVSGVLATYANTLNPEPTNVANYAYQVADAMLERRKK